MAKRGRLVDERQTCENQTTRCEQEATGWSGESWCYHYYEYKSHYHHDGNSNDVVVVTEVWVGTCDEMMNLLGKNHH